MSRIPATPAGEPAGKAYAEALRLLSYKARTRRELVDKLAGKGYPDGTIELVLERLAALGLVNDEEYAREWAETAARHKHYGPARIEASLRQRGIDREAAARAVAALLAERGEAELAADAARKKLGSRGNPTDASAVRKLIGYLTRRGFSRSATLIVLKSLRIP